jgi:hypothetical protein
LSGCGKGTWMSSSHDPARMTFRYDTFGAATFPILVSLPLPNGLEVVIRVGEVLIAELDGPWPSIFLVIVERMGLCMWNGVLRSIKCRCRLAIQPG